ncbi:unnamed protein product [Rotaria sordida]|uniref:Uncharacterized protein n=2 Tax=Rotaria sordida TaxID=392033 RepID=A0A813Y5U3_9BILA|nr:unnamed protein product [Rotaria sordida]
MFVLNNEYLEELHGQLPLTSISEFRGDISRNNFSSSSYDFGRYKKKTKLNDCSRALLCKWNTIDNENTTSEESNMIFHHHNECSYPTELITSVSTKEIADVCQSDELDYMFDHVQTLTDVNPRNLLSSNDDINKHICDSDTSITHRTLGTSFPSNDNELHFTENTNIVTQATVQDIVNTVVNESVSVNAIPVITPCTSTCKNNSDDLITNVRCQTAQATASMKLSTSLEFAHDVHPYQKTQHDKDAFDKLIDKSLLSYIMRIQGIKTKADKGKCILPRLKIPKSYIFMYQKLLEPIDLMVAVVREEKVNNKRNWYLCRDIQFLPADKNKNTEAVNPIQLNLDSLSIESDGTFQLLLRLINISSSSTTNKSDNEIFHQLDEDIVENLHPAPYDANFIRLMCILVLNHKIEWDTLCLSDYIRPIQELQI